MQITMKYTQTDLLHPDSSPNSVRVEYKGQFVSSPVIKPWYVESRHRYALHTDHIRTYVCIHIAYCPCIYIHMYVYALHTVHVYAHVRIHIAYCPCMYIICRYIYTLRDVMYTLMHAYELHTVYAIHTRMRLHCTLPMYIHGYTYPLRIIHVRVRVNSLKNTSQVIV